MPAKATQDSLSKAITTGKKKKKKKKRKKRKTERVRGSSTGSRMEGQ
jgi:hypothetical protein